MKRTQMVNKKTKTDKNIQKLPKDGKSAMSNTANNKFGASTQGFKYDKNDLGTNLPNSFVDNSGDANQRSRSEEEEMENNTDLKVRRKFSFLT